MEAKKVWGAILIAGGISAIAFGLLETLYFLFALMFLGALQTDFEIGSAIWVYPIVTLIFGFFFWGVWLIIRCVKGIKLLKEQKAYPNPKSWWF